MASGGKKVIQRMLTAILCADVVGYSRLMGADEEATIETLTDQSFQANNSNGGWR